MADYDELSVDDKVMVASQFIVQAPPGEFNEVFNDVRVLLENDDLLKESVSKTFVKYNTDQFTPCKLENSDKSVIISQHNGLPDGRFFDPRSKQSFKYDHLRREASEFHPHETDNGVESWRSPLQSEVDKYVSEHYKQGVASVFGTKSGNDITLITLIESHIFNPPNYFNGKLRSEWKVTISSSGQGTAELSGVVKVQVHYYEDGNVQLLSSKDIKKEVKAPTPNELAVEFVKKMKDAEATYQCALIDNYNTMSHTTFKALRRALPVFRTTIDWHKITSYKVGRELLKY